MIAKYCRASHSLEHCVICCGYTYIESASGMQAGNCCIWGKQPVAQGQGAFCYKCMTLSAVVTDVVIFVILVFQFEAVAALHRLHNVPCTSACSKATPSFVAARGTM